MVAAKIPSPAETQWMYQGADNDIYGPFTGQSMLEWVKSGYFKDNLLIRTIHEENFRPLGEWMRILGNKLPFFYNNLTTFDNAALCAQGGPAPPMNAIQPPFFYPPGLAPPTSFPPQFRRPNGMGGFFPDMVVNNHQQPDSLETNMYTPNEVCEPRPSTRSIGTDPAPPSVKDEGTQTLPYTIIRKANLSTASEIIVEKHGSKRVVTLNRPKALNALNLSMVRELNPKLAQWNNADDVNMIIVKGAGEKAFCAGGDVLAVCKSGKEAQTGKGTSTIHKDFFREEYILNHLIGTLRKPYIAMIDGIVMGGGCGLSVNGRFRVSTERTLLAMPETALGLFPDVGGSYFLSRLKHNLGMFLALTGYRLSGADAFHVGLANHYVPSQQLSELEKRLLSLEQIDDRSVEATIRSVEPSEFPKFSLEEHLPQIRELFFAKTVEGILDNLKKDKSEWAQKQLKILSKMSPTSLKVTHKQITDGAKMSYAKIFTMEYRLTQRFMADHDIHEGCRAILIDKDRNPKWKPAKLEDVSEETVEKYFAPLPHGEDLVIKED